MQTDRERDSWTDMREKKIISVGAGQLGRTHTHTPTHTCTHTPLYHRCSPFRKQHFKVNTLTKTRDRGTKLLNYRSERGVKLLPAPPAGCSVHYSHNTKLQGQIKKKKKKMSKCPLRSLTDDVTEAVASERGVGEVVTVQSILCVRLHEHLVCVCMHM